MGAVGSGAGIEPGGWELGGGIDLDWWRRHDALPSARELCRNTGKATESDLEILVGVFSESAD